VTADEQAAVDRKAGSYIRRSGSSSRSAEDGNTPSSIGTVICLPVRSSMIVMVSLMSLPVVSGW
jgi:hypothetical protein